MVHYFARKLLGWHKENPRTLPWSGKVADPYHIWISEIIMQQTRIEQGADYYHRFIRRFPTLHSLSSASLDEVMKYWQGLGYYTRARNLHAAAKYVVDSLGGHIPDTYEGLLTLPGIGPYSAAAISSFAFGRRQAVVDGNVKRLIARYSGLYASIDDASTHEEIRKIATAFMDDVSPGLFNQAIMNFGALVCKPKGPLCTTCPLAKKCYALRHQAIEVLPVRSKKKINTLRYFVFVVFHYRGKILLQRREGKDIWKGLYIPPLLERRSARAPSGAQLESFAGKIIGHSLFEVSGVSAVVRQLLSHQTINGRFIHVTLKSQPASLPDNFVWVSKKSMHDFAKPKMVVSMLNAYPPISSISWK